MMGSGARIQLKFDAGLKVRGAPVGIGGVQWFPGVIVGLKGKNGGGGCFMVEEVLTVSFPLIFLCTFFLTNIRAAAPANILTSFIGDGREI